MQDHVALLRSINVGGIRVVMADLKADAAALGWQSLETYIATGNVLFRSAGAAPDLARAYDGALTRRYGKSPAVVVVPGDELQAMVAACPVAPAAGKDLHGFFLFGPPAFDETLYDKLRSESETVVLAKGVAWFHAPEGVGRSKLAARMEKVLGVTATARNWNTCQALARMLAEREAAGGGAQTGLGAR